MNDFTFIVNSAIAHKARLDTARQDFDDNLLKIDINEKELLLVNDLYKNTKLAFAYLDKLINEESVKFIKKLQELITYGLRIIFYDCEYSCDIRVSDKDKATIHLVYVDDEGNTVSPDIKNCGGGVRTVVGVILQTYFLMHYNAEPILFVDEGFSAVSSSYIPYFMAFLEEMAVKKHLKILLITHDTRLESYGTKVYRITKGVSKLVSNTGGSVTVKVEGGEQDAAGSESN